MFGAHHKYPAGSPCKMQLPHDQGAVCATHVDVKPNPEENMSALIRYPLFGCAILILSACGGSGSSTLLEAPDPPITHTDVAYLLSDAQVVDARGKFSGATEATLSAGGLNQRRAGILSSGTRYLSTGATMARTDGSTVNSDLRSDASCTDAAAGGSDAPASCRFEEDAFRVATTFHLGTTNSEDTENDVGFHSFSADRQVVMSYLGVEMSQVRTAGTDLKPEKKTSDQGTVYVDKAGNRYVLSDSNIKGMNLTGVMLPEGVTTAPAFSDLTRAMESHPYEYVGYDGILQHSMFFVGIYRFFDSGGTLQHVRLENASLGQAYDENATTAGTQSPNTALTGKGVMAGIESRKNSLEHYLVQGDVTVTYAPSPATVDVAVANIVRLNDDGNAWYASQQQVLTWEDVPVTDSKFMFQGSSKGELLGSFYGTSESPEVGGVFHHSGQQHEITGSFGSKLGSP